MYDILFDNLDFFFIGILFPKIFSPNVFTSDFKAEYLILEIIAWKIFRISRMCYKINRFRVNLVRKSKYNLPKAPTQYGFRFKDGN